MYTSATSNEAKHSGPERGIRLAIFLSLVILLGSGLQPAPAQTDDVTLERVNTPEMDVPIVTSITQDRQGYMWFGAGSEGLYRYDGYELKTYRHDPADSTSLAGNWAEIVFVDAAGTLWIGTYNNSLDRYDPTSDSFVHYKLDPDNPETLVKTICQTPDRMLWIGTDEGLFSFDPDRVRDPSDLEPSLIHFQHDPEDPTSLSDDMARICYADRQGTLWIGTGDGGGTHGNGLNRFNPETQDFTRYLADPEDENSLININVMALYEDSRGQFWVGTWGDGLHLMDREKGSFTRFTYDPDQPNRPYRPRLEQGDPVETTQFTSPGIRFITEDQEGNLWIGGYWGGVNRFEPDGDGLEGRITHFEHDPQDAGSLSGNDIWTTYTSRDGTLWIGSLGGVDRVKPNQDRFHHYQLNLETPSSLNTYIVHEYQSRPNLLWVGTVAGLYLYDRENDRVVRHYTHDPNDPTSIGYDWVIEVYGTRDGTLWIGTWTGLNWLTPELASASGQGFSRFDPDRLFSIVYEDRIGIIWTGTGNSVAGELYRINPENGSFTRFRNDPSDPTSIKAGSVLSIYETSDGSFWVGTWNGLDRMDRATGTFTHIDNETGMLSGQAIYVLQEDHDGTLWIGTESGLYGYHLQTGEFSVYTAQNSDLPQETIMGIMVDQANNLWINSNSGISRFDVNAEAFYHYGINRMLGTVIWPSSHQSSRGEIFFGRQDGFVSFYPEDILATTVSTPPEVVLSGIRLFDEPITPDESDLLDRPLWDIDEITLRHDQNVFEFDFVGIHYTDPARNRHQFMLENYDVGWREAGAERRASYVKVPPGNYTFQVRAANADGVWSEESARLEVIILPPWWRTWWAYTLFGLLFITGVVLANRVQRRRLVQREQQRAEVEHERLRAEAAERELEHAHEIEQAYHQLEEAHQHLKATQAQLVQTEKLASLGQLTAGIAHEIKNPLNFVNNFSEMVGELVDELDDEVKSTQDASGADSTHHFKEILSDLKSNAEQITKHGRRADGIVSAMMQHASDGTGKREPTTVNALVEEYVNLAYHGKRAQVEGFTCEIKREYAEDMGKVELVPQDIGRVLLNLLSNAFDAVYEKAPTAGDTYQPTVRVQTVSQDDAIAIRVTDNGPGIPTDVRQKIFEPFFTTKPTGSGTGLGLSLSYDIITQGHGGTLEVESTKGKGATFTITLPY